MDNPFRNRASHPLLSPETGKEADFHKPTLIIGYGNIDRQDDGVAWHVLKKIAADLGCGVVDPFETPQLDCVPGVTIHFALQLIPEMADLIKDYDNVCFVDAHTGSVAEPIHNETIKAEYTRSPLTHHLTPSTCLALVGTLYKRHPKGLLVSIQGHEFGFGQNLSQETTLLAEDAINWIFRWINGE